MRRDEKQRGGMGGATPRDDEQRRDGEQRRAMEGQRRAMEGQRRAMASNAAP
jgi:hypothetical protein